MNILIVEENADIRIRLKNDLQSMGHEASGVDGARSAFTEADAMLPDLVLVGDGVARRDGSDFIEELRRLAGREVYSILMTEAGGDSRISKGFTDCIAAPFGLDELDRRLTVVSRILDLERRLMRCRRDLTVALEEQVGELRDTQAETIIRLLAALEARDHEGGGHVARVARFSSIMGEDAGWSAETVDDLRLAAPMHDIGKIGIPDRILLKPGRLALEEFEIIKTHSVIGGRILEGSARSMIRMAHDIARYHHERWDGTGYPEGLSGSRIPEVARIVAIADVFDTLSNDRIYRSKLPESEVMGIMSRGRGTHFDPAYYDLFESRLSEFRGVLAAEG